MQISRKDLLSAEATMNQMRNAVAHLARFMINNYVDDVIERLQRMGRNIARTYVNYWKPTDSVDLNNLKDVIATIYKNIVNSNVQVEITSDKQVIITDRKCSLCKYKYEDLDLAGCDILLGLVPELINQINAQSKNDSKLRLTPIKVSESKGYGHDRCVQLLKYSLGGA